MFGCEIVINQYANINVTFLQSTYLNFPHLYAKFSH